MADKVTIKIEGTAEIERALKRLISVGEKRTDINKVFKSAMIPLVNAGKNQAPRGVKISKGNSLSSRDHRPGTLRRSIRFKASKKKHIFYVTAGSNRNKSANAWYAHMVGQGTKFRRGNPFMDRAWNMTSEAVFKNIESGLNELYRKEWR